jgi:hypothetical protein
MKNYLGFTFLGIIFLGFVLQCQSTPNNAAKTLEDPSVKGDTIRIANEELEYEVIILDANFQSWYVTNARPRGYYNQEYLEARNRIWIAEYNRRAMNPFQYSNLQYPLAIDYQPNINYGYEVNYMLFNYLVYFQMTNRTNLGGFTARP